LQANHGNNQTVHGSGKEHCEIFPCFSSPSWFGSVTGDAKIRVEGAMNEAAGAAQQLYGQTSDAARQTATTLDTWLRNAIAIDEAAAKGVYGQGKDDRNCPHAPPS